MGKTTIEWTDLSWPVVNGCRRISPGCVHCYAERLTATRLRHMPKYEGLARYGENGPQWTGRSRLWLPDLAMPLRRRKPSRIFVADMGDVFFAGVPNEEIAAVFGVMSSARWHTFQVLTKRSERMRAWFGWVEAAAAKESRSIVDFCRERAAELLPQDDVDRLTLLGLIHGIGWPLPNVWLGVSVEDQQRADERVPDLFLVPARVRFLSVEPLLGPIDLNVAAWGNGRPRPPIAIQGRQLAAPGTAGWQEGFHPLRALDWVIVGGESGPGARPFDLAWLRDIVTQCVMAKVPLFVKQLGDRAVDSDWLEGRYAPDDKRAIAARDALLSSRVTEKTTPPSLLLLRRPKGGDMAEWPEWARVREFPEAA